MATSSLVANNVINLILPPFTLPYPLQRFIRISPLMKINDFTCVPSVIGNWIKYHHVRNREKYFFPFKNGLRKLPKISR